MILSDHVERNISISKVFGESCAPYIAQRPETDLHLVRLGKIILPTDDEEYDDNDFNEENIILPSIVFGDDPFDTLTAHLALSHL